MPVVRASEAEERAAIASSYQEPTSDDRRLCVIAVGSS
jgi:hypothetical protein